MRPGPLAAARERHDAKRAHVVASPHDADEGGGTAVSAPHRGDVSVRLLQTQLYVDGGAVRTAAAATVVIPCVATLSDQVVPRQVAPRRVYEPGQVAVRVRSGHRNVRCGAKGAASSTRENK